MTNAAVEKWRQSVPPGRCPGCRRPVPPKKKYLCGRRVCRKKYQTIRQNGTRTPTFWRTVESATPVAGTRAQMLVTLSCKHQIQLPRSRVKAVKRLLCTACRREQKHPGK